MSTGYDICTELPRCKTIYGVKEKIIRLLYTENDVRTRMITGGGVGRIIKLEVTNSVFKQAGRCTTYIYIYIYIYNFTSIYLSI